MAKTQTKEQNGNQPEAENDKAARASEQNLGEQTQAKAVVPAKPKVPADSNGNCSDEAVDLLLEACDLFGINPDPETRPIEMLSWRYYAGDRRTDTPAKVVVVTAGGQKLSIWEDPDVPLEPETEETLRNIFNAWRVDPVTKLKVPAEMPNDLTLPRAAVTGLSDSQAHVYRGGYLRGGGKREAAKRDAERRGDGVRR